MARYLLKRLGLAIITLFLLSLIIFLAGQVLPGDPARSILGPLAAESAVRALDHQLGVDRPLVTQYWSWITGMLHGNMGESYQYQSAVEPLLRSALANSAKLAALALIVIIPVGILGGVVAALNAGRRGPDHLADWLVRCHGARVRVRHRAHRDLQRLLKVLPATAAAPAGSSFPTQLRYLILPAVPLVFVLFGYIARMARAGTIEALESDYVRTATLKGLKRHVVIWRHVLRNSLLPTITVIATQTGYLIGGLVVVETLFNYQGIGNLIFHAANSKDFPMLEAGVLTVGVVYMVATLIADVLTTVLNPRLRTGAIQ